MPKRTPEKPRPVTADTEKILASLRTVSSKRRSETRDFVASLIESLPELHDKGYSLSDIAQHIQGMGYHFPIGTFRNYLQELGYKHKAANPQRRKAAAKPRKRPSTSGSTAGPANARTPIAFRRGRHVQDSPGPG